VTVTWEYTVIPSSPVQRFACTSNREEFHELLSEMPSTSTWFMTPRPGFNATPSAAATSTHTSTPRIRSIAPT
jgi:hypothetical protein